ncbi:MAG: aldehyde dehydrogenase family protein, partial [Nitrososphaeria archaeon]
MTEFKNEFTFRKFSEEGRENEFHLLFEQALEDAKRDWLGKEYPLYIGDREITTEGKLTERSPIDGRVICICQKADRKETKMAIDAAMEAFDEWGKMSYIRRSRLMLKAADHFSKNKFVLSAVLSMENGKNRFESMGEVDEAIDFLRYYSLEMLKNRGYGDTVYLHGSRARVSLGFHGSPGKGERVYRPMKPYGVFGVIAPFNFPVSISTGMSTGAIVTGNTVVFKPSSTGNMSMLTGVMIYHLFRDAGLPPGVFNYISGPGTAVGDELATNSSVSGIV